MLWVLLDQKIIFGIDFSYSTKTISVLLQLQFSTQLLHDHGTAPLQPWSPHDNFPLSAVSPVCSAAVSHCCRENGQIIMFERAKVWSKSKPHNLCRSNGDLTAVCGQVAAWFI